jgi:uracil-DNA glycosylase family 4
MTNIQNLFDEVQDCHKCYGDNLIYVPFPDPNNALESAQIMFVNERPGRIGTGDSGYVSFDNNDPSAEFFKECQLNLDRKQIYITNACLCHPVFPEYKDKAPTKREILNCHEWLGRQLSIIQPKLIVTVGSIALKSLTLFFSSSEQLKHYQLKKDIGKAIRETIPWVYPLCHTSRRGRTHRNEEKQKLDWLKIPYILEEINLL